MVAGCLLVTANYATVTKFKNKMCASKKQEYQLTMQLGRLGLVGRHW